MRVGIVGTGFMGSVHARAWAETPAKLMGVVSKSAETAVSLTQQYGGKHYPDLASLLLDVDVVDICVPTHRHHAIALSAAAAGKHVVCEKPLARTLAQADEIIAACTAAGVKLLVGHVVRYFPEYAQAKAQVAAGKIGSPAVIRLTRGSSQPKWATDNWLLDFDKSGGLMLDLMIHDFDYARWVAGDVVRVFAKKMNGRLETEAAHEVGNHALAILTHRHGAISHIEGSWAYPAPMFRTRLEIAGENGLIQVDSDETTSIRSYLHETVISGGALPSSPLAEDPFTTQIKAFYAHLAADTPVAVTAVDAYKALQIALAAVESAQTGEAVVIEDVP